jgi:hypothetical protein
MSATAAPAAPAPAAAIPPGLLATPTGDWKTLSDALTAEAPAIAGHPIPVACAPGAGLGSPACHIPEVPGQNIPGLPVIEIDGNLLGVPPATARPGLPSDRARYAAFWGAFTHEGAHAAHTLARKPPAERAAWCQAAHQLEESRAEGRQVTRRPGDRRWLRATVTQLILDDFTAAGAAPSTPREAGSAAALVLARGDAGILDPSETALVEAKVEAVTGHDTLERLRATWREFLKIADDDARTLARLARRWCRILGIDPDTPPPAPVIIEIPSELAEAIAEAIREIAAEVAADLAPPPAFPPGKAAQRAAENAARSRAGKASEKVFGTEDPPAAAKGTRDPRDDEAAAARRLARALRDATAGTRATTTATSQLPPGRLRMSRAVAARAQRAAGAVPTAEPFTRTTSRRVPAPPLKVGIACDISGSMEPFTGPVASAAWILARAASHIPAATTATVLYSSRVDALTHPGRAPAQVTDFTAPYMGHKIGLALDALDGALDLARPGTARLLAIVSDTDYADDEAADGQQRITRLAQAGCGVIILRPARAYHGTHTWTGCQVTDIDDPADTIDAIARAAARALTA